MDQTETKYPFKGVDNISHLGEYGYGLWPVVIINVIFLMFIITLVYKPRTSTDWKSMGSLGAFFVALFTEMYGYPLTIYLLSSWLGKRYPVVDPFSHENGHLVSVFYDSNLVKLLVHPGTDLIIIASLIIIAVAWKHIHQAGDKMVTHGMYSYVRHPQYTAFMIIILAFLVQWPTIITLVMTPILITVYYRLALKEEKYMLQHFGEDYREYMKNSRRFLPSPLALARFFQSREQKETI